MKAKTLKKWMCLSLLSIGLWSCEKTDLPLESTCIEARLINHVCSHAVIQILSPEYAHLGEDGWVDRNGVTYDNVFSTLLHCIDIGQVPEIGETFFFNVRDKQEPQTCVVCLALPSRMPDARLEVEIASGCGGLDQ